MRSANVMPSLPNKASSPHVNARQMPGNMVLGGVIPADADRSLHSAGSIPRAAKTKYTSMKAKPAPIANI